MVHFPMEGQQVGLFRTLLDEEAWQRFLQSPTHKMPLLAVWADDRWATMLMLDNESPVLLSTPVVMRRYHAPSARYPAAAWGEAMAHDLWGVEAIGGNDHALRLDEGGWTVTWPLSGHAMPVPIQPVKDDDRSPGSFVVSSAETGLPGALDVQGRLEKGCMRHLSFHLVAAHRGMALRLRGQPVDKALRLVARASAAGFVAHPLAFVRAVEQAEGLSPTSQERDVRLLLLEIERISVHLFDLTRVAHEAGAGMLATYCAHTREAVARLCQKQGLSRQLTDQVRFAGESDADEIATIRRAAQSCVALVQERLPQIAALQGIFATRFTGVARLPTETAWRYAVGGVAGRSSGRPFDTRRREVGMRSNMLRATGQHSGCALARNRQRLAEIRDSVALLQRIDEDFGPEDRAVPFPCTQEGLGVAEGPRGDVWYWVCLKDGKIEMLHVSDPTLPLLGTLSEVLDGQRPDQLAMGLASFGLSAAGASF